MKVLGFNLTDSSRYEYTFGEELILGGRSLTTQILYNNRNNVPLDAFDPTNVVAIGAGLLAGTEFPSSGRTAVSVLKSPVSGFFGDGNLGGFFGPYLRMCGFFGIEITGESAHPVGITISSDGQVEEVDATDVCALGNVEIHQYLQKTYGKNSRSLHVGQAFFSQPFCTIVFSDKRAAGGGGTGAVLARKNIKFITVIVKEDKLHDIKPPSGSRRGFSELCEKVKTQIEAHPVFDLFSNYGTTSLVELHASMKYLPNRNWTSPVCKNWKKVSGTEYKKQYEDPKEDRKALNAEGTIGCRNCPIVCSGSTKMEYEILNCLGPKIGIENLKDVVELNELFHQYGVDVIQASSVLSTLMDMFEQGDSMIKLEWGDLEQSRKFFVGMFTRTGLGGQFSDGLLSGLESIKYRLRIQPEDAYDKYFVGQKGVGLSGVYFNHKNRGVALACSTSTRGADHLRALPTLAAYSDWYMGKRKGIVKKLLKIAATPISELWFFRKEAKTVLSSNLYETYHKLFGVPRELTEEWDASNFLFEDGYENWAPMITYNEAMYAVADALSFCRFTTSWRFGIGLELLAEAVTFMSGTEWDWKKLYKAGRRLQTMERDLLYYYNKPVLDAVPKKFHKNNDLDIEQYEVMLKEYYDRSGFDISGRPTLQTLNNLHIGEIYVSD